MTACDTDGVRRLIVPSNITPNGPLHVGHLAGPLLGADVLVRAARERGERAALLIGTAWQYSHVRAEAQRRGVDPVDFAQDMSGRIEASFAAAQIAPDYMLRRSETRAIDAVSGRAFQALYDAGLLADRTGLVQYCPECADFRFQGFTEGNCPHCGSSDASGVDCEGCAHYHDDAELLSPRCATCTGATVPRPVRRIYVELERARGWLASYLDSVQLDESVRRFADAVLSRPLPSVAITWSDASSPAAPTPFGPEQRLFPAFELASRYVVMAHRLPDHDTAGRTARRTTMLFGFDNAFERVILFPVILKAISDARAPLPTVLHMTYFALLDGAKFSTSRRHAITVDDAVARFGSDEVRLYVAAPRPVQQPETLSARTISASVEVQTVRALQAWGRTGVVPHAVSQATENSWAQLVEATAQFDDAVRPGGLSCRTSAHSLVTTARI